MRPVVEDSGPRMGGDEHTFLRLTREPPAMREHEGELRVADLFSGVGGITIGIREAARQLGLQFRASLAMDADQAALECFTANFAPHVTVAQPIDSILKAPDGGNFSAAERNLRERVGPIDILVGGPPCQGHSDFNNSTRRNDPKNLLYLLMARATRLFEPKYLMIENVVGALNDRNKVVQRTRDHLNDLGYQVALGVVDMEGIGVPQTRRRVIMLASRDKPVSIDQLTMRFATENRDLRWAIGDLEDASADDCILDESSTPSRTNAERIDYLFERGEFDLPDEMRPACHRNGGHSYKSIYGRLSWEKPAQTITRGFYSTCMGRYVHPSRRRTLTAHEAARIQFFPDFFDFSSVPNRTTLARLIGNAVPSKLGFAATLELLAGEQQ